MPVSDLYLVQYLIQSSQEDETSLVWRESEASEFRAELNGVSLSLFSAHSSDGSRICLRLSRTGQRAYIEEPHSVGLISVRYRNEEDRSLAEALRLLAQIASNQCTHRRAAEFDHRESIRESLFQQLLFGGSDSATSIRANSRRG